MKSQMTLKNCDLNQPSRSQVESEELDTNKHKNEKIWCDLDPLKEHEKRNDSTVELTQMKENITTHETNERKCHDLQDYSYKMREREQITSNIKINKMVSIFDNQNQCKLS